MLAVPIDMTEDWQAIGDDEVMAAVQAGSANAFAVLYERYYGRAYRIARSVCRDGSRAEDAVQETFTAIWKTRATYESQAGAVGPWVLTVARNRSIDIARRHARDAARQTSEAKLHAALAPGDVDVDEQVVLRALARQVIHLLGQLPDAQREVLALGFYGELTHREIAAHLNLPHGTVKGRMRLGLQRLRGGLQH